MTASALARGALMRAPRLVRRVPLAFAVAAVSSFVFAVAASANTGTVTITCTSATFNYAKDFPKGTNVVTESIKYDSKTVRATFSFPGPGPATNTVAISLPTGTTSVTADAVYSNSSAGITHKTVRGFPVTERVKCVPPPCPPGTSVNFRWHYSVDGSAGSWSATQSQTCPTSSFTMGPQAMEGNQTVNPGTTIKAGYDFTDPGYKTPFQLTVDHAMVSFPVVCASGTPTQSTFSVPLGTRTYHVTSNQWYPSGDQSSSLVYQGSYTVPNPNTLCSGGGPILLGQGGSPGGGTFSAGLS